MNITLTKLGEVFKSKGYTQYPTPYMFKRQDGEEILRIYYTDREDNKSIPCYVDLDPKDFSIKGQAEKVLPLGLPGEFDEDGISIQFQSNTTLWYTGYAKGSSTPYKTMIGTAEYTKSGELRKTGICLGLSRHNPLSVCTPFVYSVDNKAVFFYNTHTGWDTKSTPTEAMYMIKGQKVQDPWSPVINPYEVIFQKAGSDHSYARPWAFIVGKETVVAYSYRHNYGHREDSNRSYKPGFYNLTTRRNIDPKLVGMDKDFMVAYTSIINLSKQDKMYFFYNNSYDSGIQYGELTYEV